MHLPTQMLRGNDAFPDSASVSCNDPTPLILTVQVDTFLDMNRASKRLGGEPILFASEDLDALPPVNDLDKEYNNLIIFDDMVTQSAEKQKQIADYFIRARKRQCTCMYLSQDYFGVPINIRKNLMYLVIIRLGNPDDIDQILRRQDMLGLEPEQARHHFQVATGRNDGVEIGHFLLVDKVTTDPAYKLRYDFDPIEQLRADQPHQKFTPENTKEIGGRDEEKKRAKRRREENLDALGRPSIVPVSIKANTTAQPPRPAGVPAQKRVRFTSAAAPTKPTVLPRRTLLL